ncbi:fimbria/pilus outer membrane usher protein [Glaciimonas sp. GG7]
MRCVRARSSFAVMVSAAIVSLSPAQEVIAAELEDASIAETKSAKGKPSTAATFDLDILKQRGIDPKVAEYLREAPRFSGGTRLISVQVNGVMRGLVNALFDADGQLCFNQALLDKAGLITPDKKYLIAPGDPANGCYDFKAMAPQTEIELRPGKEEVALVVPGEVLRVAQEDFSGYQTGGTGGLFNYSVVSLSNQFKGGASHYLSANTELGLNAHDWIVRSRQSYMATDTLSNFQFLYSYAQRTFVDLKSIVQAGQLNIRNSAVSGAAMTGVQILPEAALRKDGSTGATVTGIAQSQAKVEVRQSGALIYSTVVPAGPFTLTDIAVLNSTSDLVVTVIETTGGQRSFTIPAASLANTSLAAPGYAFAFGQLRNMGGQGRANASLVMTGSGGWLLKDRHLLSAGLMVVPDYQSAAWSLDTKPSTESSIHVRNVVSSATEEGVLGSQLSMSVGMALTDTLTAGLSTTHQSAGYRDLVDRSRCTVDRSGTDDWLSGRAKSQYSASLGWSNATLGGFNVSYGASRTFGDRSTQRVVGSWSKSFKQATVSANLESSLGASGEGKNNRAFYLNVSMPFGGRSVRSFVNNANGKSRLGASTSEQVNAYLNYNVSTERDASNGNVDVAGNVALLPRYAQVNLGYSRSGSGSTSYSGQLRGAIAVHDAGLTLSPYAIQDTFAVMKVANVAGIKVNTGSGPVWTDIWGRAVVPQLSPYAKTRLEVATKSLPRNVDIKNGFKSLEVGRGSVHYVDFDIEQVRRVLITATDSAGLPLPKGALVVDSQNQFLTSVIDGGTVFLSNSQLADEIRVHLPDGRQCSLEFTLSKKHDMDAYFERVDGYCKPLTLSEKT